MFLLFAIGDVWPAIISLFFKVIRPSSCPKSPRCSLLKVIVSVGLEGQAMLVGRHNGEDHAVHLLRTLWPTVYMGAQHRIASSKGRYAPARHRILRRREHVVVHLLGGHKHMNTAMKFPFIKLTSN